MAGNVPQFLFPVAALLAGILSGLFGIGGGILLNPALLHMGIHPQVTAATCAFMMLFTSSMTSSQYLLLGTVGPAGFQALALAAGCAAASAIGLHARQGCVHRLGRPSVIVFAVGAIMALSTVSMTCLGVLDVWRDYRDGGKMGFKALC